MKQIWNMTKHFLRVQLAYKTTFIVTLLLPIASLVFSRSDQFFTSVEIQDYLPTLMTWVSFVTINYGISNANQNILIRDQNFLKMFSVLSGNHFIVLFGELFSQYIMMLVAGLTLGLLSVILFGIPILQTILYILICCTTGYWLFAPALIVLLRTKIQAEQIQPFNFSLFIVMMLTFNVYTFAAPAPFFLLLTNPMVFVIEIGKVVANAVFNTAYSVVAMPTITVAVLFVMLGLTSLKKAKIVPEYRS